MATKTVFYLSGTTAAIPSDYDSSNNTWYAFGAGGQGGLGGTNTSSGGGGASGAFSSQTNIILTPGSNVTIQVGLGNGGNASGNDTFLKDNAGTIRLLAQSGGNASGVSGGSLPGIGRAVGTTITNGSAGRTGQTASAAGGQGGSDVFGGIFVDVVTGAAEGLRAQVAETVVVHFAQGTGGIGNFGIARQD